jgi:hypothetical protein
MPAPPAPEDEVELVDVLVLVLVLVVVLVVLPLDVVAPLVAKRFESPPPLHAASALAPPKATRRESRARARIGFPSRPSFEHEGGAAKAEVGGPLGYGEPPQDLPRALSASV